MILSLLLQLLAALPSAPLYPDEEITLLFVGDAMQHAGQIASAKNFGYDYTPCFEAVADEVGRADYAVVNLEVPLGGKPYTGYPCFSAPDSYAEALQRVGFDLQLNANNHALDRSSAGLKRTIHVLDSLHVAHVGTYLSDYDRFERYPYLCRVGHFRIAFLNYTYGTNGIRVSPPCRINYIDREQIRDDVRCARRLGADLIVACMHWGEEYKLVHNAGQARCAEMLIEEGVQLVIGAHPHVVQPMEMRYHANGEPQALIVYSLGNFISNMNTADTRGGAMVRVVIGRKDGMPVVRRADYALLYTLRPENDSEPFRIVPAAKLPADTTYSEKRRNECALFLKNARAVFSRYNRGVDEYTF